GFTDYDDSNIDNSTGFRLLGGYRIPLQNQFSIAPEVFYTNFGDADIKGTNLEVEVSGFGFGARGGITTINPNLELFARLALFFWDVDVSGGRGRASDDGTDLLIGFGAEYNLNRQIGLNIAYEFVDLDDVDADTLRLGASYRF